MESDSLRTNEKPDNRCGIAYRVSRNPTYKRLVRQPRDVRSTQGVAYQ